jgi:CubicO group peptidase (beta-lactamase class C family)
MIPRSIMRGRRSHDGRLMACAGSSLLVISLFVGMRAQPAHPSTGPTKAESAATGVASRPADAREMTAADLSAFLDGIMPLQLAREDIAGAVVFVVKDGKALFEKGYGYADVEKKTPVTPEGTLFRVASISKLFTWTAVMQLVEEGKLDLDRDVNDYLDLKIPATYAKPITMRNLMTHTPGFEETAKDMEPPSANDLKPLGDYLKAHVPARIFPPGVISAYSNSGAALAGYIVQRVSGQPFDDYIEQHVLFPLGMRHSTFRQPLPNVLTTMMSNGYTVASEPAEPFEVIQDEPAGSASMTAADISRFMVAHLQDGKHENAQILRPETARLMHSRQFASHPEMNAMALGFYEETRNGHRIIGHGGDLLCFHSDLHLILDAGVGFFVSYNSMGKGEISPRTAVWHAFLDRYFPYELPAASAVADAAQDAKAVSGSYIISRRFETNFLAVIMLLGQMKVSPDSNNTIRVDMLKDMNGQPKRFREISPLLFRDVDGQDRVAFKRDDSGRLVAVIDYPFMIGQRASWHQSAIFNLVVIGGALAVCLLTLVLWPITYFIRRHYGRTLMLSPKLRKLRIWVRVVCAVDLIFAIAFATILSLAEKHGGLLSSRMDPWLHLLQIIGGLGVLGTAVMLWNAAESWRSPERGMWSKLGDMLIVLAALGFSWFVVAWNMLHWNLNY